MKGHSGELSHSQEEAGEWMDSHERSRLMLMFEKWRREKRKGMSTTRRMQLPSPNIASACLHFFASVCNQYHDIVFDCAMYQGISTHDSIFLSCLYIPSRTILELQDFMQHSLLCVANDAQKTLAPPLQGADDDSTSQATSHFKTKKIGHGFVRSTWR